MNLAEMVVAFNPEPTARRVKRAIWSLVFRVVSAAISLGICVYISYSAGKDWADVMRWGMYGIWGIVTAFWLGVSTVSLVGALRDRRRIGQGAALRLSPAGIWLNGNGYAWGMVSALWAKAALSGAGPKLVVQTSDGTWDEIPFSFLDASIGSIDSAVRAYGQPGVDLVPLDQLA